MLELRLEKANATFLKKAVSALSYLSSGAASLAFSASAGMELQAMDAHHLALAVLVLPAAAFTHSHLSPSPSHSHSPVGLSLAEMARAFRCSTADDDDDIVTIKLDEDWQPDTVTVAFESSREHGLTTQTHVHLDLVDLHGVLPLDIHQHPEPPEHYYQAVDVVRIPSASFARICERLTSFGDDDRDPVVSISVDEESVKFTTWVGTTLIVCKAKEPTTTVIVQKQDRHVSMMFDLRCVNCFSKASTLSDQVTIRISSEMPTVFEYKIAETGYVSYHIVAMEEKDRRDEGDDEMPSQANEEEDQMVQDE